MNKCYLFKDDKEQCIKLGIIFVKNIRGIVGKILILDFRLTTNTDRKADRYQMTEKTTAENPKQRKLNEITPKKREK